MPHVAEASDGNRREATAPVAPFPVAYSLLSTEALLAEVARTYTVGRPMDGVLVRSYVNDVYAISTSTGRYILKVYRARWRSSSEIAWEVDALAHLSAKGVAVAAAIPRRDGRLIGTLHAPEGTRYAVLFDHAEGAKPVPPFTAPLYYHFGRAAARMHQALNDFTSVHARVPLDLTYLIDRPLMALRPRLAHRADDWDFLVRFADKVRDCITILAARGLDWGVCHGDMTLDNLHVASDNRVIFYDFDSGGPGWRAYDLPGIYQFGRGANWDAFLAGYTEVRPFGPADLAAVPYFAAANGLWSMGGRVRNWTAWSGAWLSTDTYFDEQLAQWREWDAAELTECS